MTSEERRGRLYLGAFMAAVLVLDLAVKALLALQGTLRLSQIGGTAVTIAALWFLWKGSKFAFWFLVACLTLAAAAFALAFYGVSNLIAAVGVGFIAALGLALAAPATQSFLRHQRGRVV